MTLASQLYGVHTPRFKRHQSLTGLASVSLYVSFNLELRKVISARCHFSNRTCYRDYETSKEIMKSDEAGEYRINVTVVCDCRIVRHPSRRWSENNRAV
jgi:hypothetical protein